MVDRARRLTRGGERTEGGAIGGQGSDDDEDRDAGGDEDELELPFDAQELGALLASVLVTLHAGHHP